MASSELFEAKMNAASKVAPWPVSPIWVVRQRQWRPKVKKKHFSPGILIVITFIANNAFGWKKPRKGRNEFEDG
jgi:hypothetical protein